MKTIYLDHNATTPLRAEVLAAMTEIYENISGNPSSVHFLGRTARKRLEAGRERVAEAVGARPEEIVFTGGGTEADNLAVQGIAYAYRSKGDHIITSAIEHPAVLAACRFLEKEGFSVTYLPVSREGLVDPGELEEAIRPATILISVMTANNETGVIQPITEIGRIARDRKIPFHTDAIQGLGKIPLSVEEMGVDLMSLSGHKVYGPQGVGALYIRKGVRVRPLTYGGHHERGKRPGTENLAGIVGFGAACRLAVENLESESDRLRLLRDQLCSGISERIPRVKLNGAPGLRLPNTVNLSFEYVEGEGILLGLEEQGIAAATGSACTSGELAPSHVLSAMGVEAALAQGSVRFSLGRENTLEDILFTVDALVPVVKRLREMSPFFEPEPAESQGDKR
ncbi:MAG: cysteine desulfurase NifS [Candidatus Erginobacter occultus]|nr:cysteine desulfurase NifS [Candidatus Erginobacter occultus]